MKEILLERRGKPPDSSPGQAQTPSVGRMEGFPVLRIGLTKKARMITPETRRLTVRDFLLILLGGILLTLCVLGGLFPEVKQITGPHRSWERFDPGLAGSVRSLDDALEFASAENPGLAEMQESLRMRVWFNLVVERFSHGLAQHSPRSNWILWLMGHLHPAFSHVYDPGAMLAGSTALICDQQATVLMELAHRSGIPVRKMALGGHVVVETLYQGKWHMYDPDLEMIPLSPTGEVLSVAELAMDELVLTTVYSGPRSSAVPLIRSTGDNFPVPYPGHVVWQDQYFALFERVMQVGKWVIPLALLALGITGMTLNLRGPDGSEFFLANSNP